MDVLFEDPNMAVDAVYITGAGATSSVRVMRREADPDIRALGSRVSARTNVFEVRVSDVPEPVAGDQLRLGSAFFDVQGTPLLDTEGLIWTLDTRPTA